MANDTFLQTAEEQAYREQIAKLDDGEFLEFLDELYLNVRSPALRAALQAMIERLTG